MIYFKKVLLNNPGKEQLESALRKVALKRNSPLDFTSSGMITGTDKRFFGAEGKDSTTFTRIRYSVGNLMPKLIIRFPKGGDAQLYQLRLSFRSSAVFCFLTAASLVMLICVFKYPGNAALFAFIALFYQIFILLIQVEIKLTNKAINRTITSPLQTAI